LWPRWTLLLLLLLLRSLACRMLAATSTPAAAAPAARSTPLTLLLLRLLLLLRRTPFLRSWWLLTLLLRLSLAVPVALSPGCTARVFARLGRPARRAYRARALLELARLLLHEAPRLLFLLLLDLVMAAIRASFPTFGIRAAARRTGNAFR